MQELYPADCWMAGALGCLSVPVSCESDPERLMGRPVAVSGQALRNLSVTEAAALLDGGCVILDGESVETLCSMGLGGRLGIRSMRWVLAETNVVTMEETAAGRRMTMQGPVGRIAAVDYEKAPEILTTACDNRGKAVMPGMTVIDGRVLILPYGCFSTETYALFAGSRALFNPVRQRIVTEFLRRTSAVPFAERAPFVYVYQYRQPSREILFVVNASLDAYDDTRIWWPGEGVETAALLRGGSRVQVQDAEGGVLLAGTLEPMETAVLIRAKKGAVTC